MIKPAIDLFAFHCEIHSGNTHTFISFPGMCVIMFVCVYLFVCKY